MSQHRRDRSIGAAVAARPVGQNALTHTRTAAATAFGVSSFCFRADLSMSPELMLLR